MACNTAHADVCRSTPIACTTPVARESPYQSDTPVPYNTCSTPVVRISPRHSITPVQLNTCSPSILQSSYGRSGTPVIKSTCSTPVTQGRPAHCSTPAPWRQGADDLRHVDAIQSSGVLQNSQKALRSSRHGASDRSGIPYIDMLTDETLTAVFLSGLNSLDLCRCAAACKRWNKLVWNPILWTSVDLRNLPQIDVDQALRCLTRILSRDTPTVCVTVVKVVLSYCQRLTDQGLYTIAKRCTELSRLEMAGCRRVTNVAVFEVVSRCVSLVHLDVTGTCDVILFVMSFTLIET
jgi:F-box-like